MACARRCGASVHEPTRRSPPHAQHRTRSCVHRRIPHLVCTPHTLMQPVMAHRGSGSTATVTMTVASGHGGEIGQTVAQAGTQVRNADQIADAPLFEPRVEPADASKAAAGWG